MDTPFDSTLKSDVKELMKEVPPPIRAFFVSGKVEAVAKNLMQKNQLHIDQGAIVEREIILLLLGLKSPTEFTKTLAEEARLDQQTVNSIVQDINMQIFVPLREEEMKSGTGNVQQSVKSTEPTKPPASPGATQGTARPAIPVPVRQMSMPAPKYYEPPPQSPKYLYSSEDKIISFRPAQPPVFPRATPPPLKATESTAHPAIMALSKPMVSDKLLEDHEEPHIEFTKAPMTPPAAGPAPISSPPRPMTPPPAPPRPTTPPSNLPGAARPSENFGGGVIGIPPVPPKPYPSDPYREPIDEKE